MNDTHIVNLIRSRDEKGLSELYDRYAAPLLGIIRRTVKEQTLSEDILSQTMLKAWNKMSSYDENKSSLFTWLSVIARNTAIDKVRLKSYQMTNKTENIDGLVYEMEGTKQTSDAAIDVERITSRLSEKYQIVLQLMYLEGYSQSDIAEKLSIPLGTVKTRLRTAILTLRDELKNEKGLFMGLVLIVILQMLLMI